MRDNLMSVRISSGLQQDRAFLCVASNEELVSLKEDLFQVETVFIFNEKYETIVVEGENMSAINV